jgi:excisionase family DNA binding protein
MTTESIPADAAGQFPRLLTVPEVALRLRISQRSLWRLIANGQIVAPLRIGGLVRWRESDIADWLLQNCPKPSRSNSSKDGMIDRKEIGTIKDAPANETGEET